MIKWMREIGPEDDWVFFLNADEEGLCEFEDMNFGFKNRFL